MERKENAVRIPKGPGFFKVLVGEYNDGLLIPKLFVKKYRSILQEKAVLRVFPDRRWTVDIVEEDVNELYFKNGWKTFVKDNGLRCGEFVIFEYEGNSTFKVKMYGFSCCDKAIEMRVYQCNSIDAEKGKQHQEASKEEVSKRDDKKAEQQRKEENETIEIESDSDREIGQGGYRRQTQKKRRRLPSVFKEGSRQLKLKNPAFQTVLTHTSIEKRFLNIPGYFSKKHLQNMGRKVELHTMERKWIVKMTMISSGSCRYAKLSKGWMEFVRDNKLEVGKTCVFELIWRNKPSFQVHVLENQ